MKQQHGPAPTDAILDALRAEGFRLTGGPNFGGHVVQARRGDREVTAAAPTREQAWAAVWGAVAAGGGGPARGPG